MNNSRFLTVFFVLTTLLPFTLGQTTWSLGFYDGVNCGGTLRAAMGDSAPWDCTNIDSSILMISALSTGDIGGSGGFSIGVYTDENCGGDMSELAAPNWCQSELYEITNQPHYMSFEVVSNP